MELQGFFAADGLANTSREHPPPAPLCLLVLHPLHPPVALALGLLISVAVPCLPWSPLSLLYVGRHQQLEQSGDSEE